MDRIEQIEKARLIINSILKEENTMLITNQALMVDIELLTLMRIIHESQGEKNGRKDNI